MKTEERATFILSQLNVGLRTEWSQIEGLEANLGKAAARSERMPIFHLTGVMRGVAGWKLRNGNLRT